MVYHGLRGLPDVDVQFLPNPYWMMKSFKNQHPQEIRKIWGKGFTLYGLLDDPKPNFDVEDSDLIIVGLHHTMCNNQRGFYHAVKEMVDKFGKDKVCVVDGSDRTEFSDETAGLCTYFKRELLDDRTTAKPIFFGVPEEKFEWNTTEKKVYDFAPMVPANYCWDNCEHIKSYIYDTEEELYKQYQQSYFAYSCKKGGWATGRQNEIIINRCLPYVTDIESYPKRCLFKYPKELCIQVKKLKGVLPGTVEPYDPQVNTFIGDTRMIKPGDDRGRIDWDTFDLTKYNELVGVFLDYAWNYLTTKALGKYILSETF